MSRGGGTPVRRVVVIGGSLTGLLTAAALSGAGREVVVVERDQLPTGAAARPGVPQGTQAHVFLLRGLQAAEELLPGLRAELLTEGALPINGGQLLWLSEDGWLPNREDGLEIVSATRPLLEHVVRRRALALPGVTSRQGVRVSTLRRGGDGWEVGLEDGTTLAADLVVDASGRTSRLPVWLAELGVAVPDPDHVDARVGYATRVYAARDDTLSGCAGVVVGATPDTLTGALALPAEGGRWMVCAVGYGDRRPPRDNDGFEAFLAGLVDPAVAQLAARCDPVGDVHVHRQTANFRHPYEKVGDWPDGLLAVGDALCAFDPVYGQGITVGAVQALVLRRATRRGLRTGDVRRLQAKVAASVAIPWSIATSADLTFPTCDGEQTRMAALLSDWAGVLTRLSIHGDHRATDSMSRVYNLVLSPVALFHPALVLAAVRARLLGHGPGTTRPALLEELSRAAADDGTAARLVERETAG